MTQIKVEMWPYHQLRHLGQIYLSKNHFLEITIPTSLVFYEVYLIIK